MNEAMLPDGRRLAWREAGAGRPLVLLHGWSMSSAVFAEVMAGLGDGLRVLAPDLRGHGRSQEGAGYALADFGADLQLWLDHLDVGESDLLGWSFGGQVALRMVLDRPRRFRRLALVSTTPRFVAEGAWEHGLPAGQVRSMARNLARAYEKTMGDFFARQFGPDEVGSQRLREIIAFAVRAGNLPTPETALATLDTLATGDLRSELAAVACPALVLHGCDDQIIPAGAGRFLAAQIPGARRQELAATGHAPFLSRPQPTLAALREFLR